MTDSPYPFTLYENQFYGMVLYEISSYFLIYLYIFKKSSKFIIFILSTANQYSLKYCLTSKSNIILKKLCRYVRVFKFAYC